MKRLIIFTDLDGTLLDHDSYSWLPAAGALERIRKLGIPLVLNTSKTVAELELLRAELHNDHPFIIENGGAVCIPPGSFDADGGGEPAMHLFGQPYAAIRAELESLRQAQGFDFRGFGDMTDAEVAERTGLDEASAARARQRNCSEPLVWQESEARLQEFTAALAAKDLQVVRGGRFHHVTGNSDKGTAMRWLLDACRNNAPHDEWVSIALGDSENDLPMLLAADYAVVIRPAHSEPLRPDRDDNLIETDKPGPAGWQDAISRLLDQLGG